MLELALCPTAAVILAFTIATGPEISQNQSAHSNEGSRLFFPVLLQVNLKQKHKCNDNTPPGSRRDVKKGF